jgi:hypothetical protein
MDALADGNATTAELSLANEFRMHKKVATLADIVDVEGKTITPEGLDDSIAPSSLRFGKQAPPSDRAGQTWRRLLRRRFATGISPHTRHSHGFTLDIPLGPWSQDSPRHLTVAWSYCPKTDILYRAFHDELQELQYRAYRPQVYRTEKYYRTDEVICEIDACYIPVEIIDFLEYVRIRGGAPINRQMTEHPPATFEEHIHSLPEYLQRIIGRVSYRDDELEELANKITAGKIIFVSDGSMAQGKGTSAYKMVDPNDPDLYILGTSPCDSHPSCIQSFRAELNGILGEIILSGEIRRFLGKDQPTATITTYCDNVSALGKLEKTEEKPGIRHKLGADYDLVNELKLSLEKYGINVTPKHVKGHQDSDKAYEELSFEAQMNCDCDKAADEHMHQPPDGLAPRDSAPFLPSSKIGLLLDGKLITSNIEQHIRMQREGIKLQRRIMSKEGWTQHTFDSIDWDSHEIAFRKLGRSRFKTRVVQFEHRWLPMGKQLHRINSEHSNLCPVCKSAEEDQTHFLTCSDEKCRSNFLLQLALLHKSLQKKKILGAVWSQIKSRLLHEMGYSSVAPSFPEAAQYDEMARHIQRAVREQEVIGWVNFLRGRISPHWGKAQGRYYHEAQLASKTLSAQTFQTALIKGTWSFFHGMWEHRNGILHDANMNINIERMDQRIQLLYRDPSTFVRPSSLCLFEAFTLDECINLHPSIKQTWLKTIFLAIQAKHGDLKCLDADSNQTNITDFFS